MGKFAVDRHINRTLFRRPSNEVKHFAKAVQGSQLIEKNSFTSHQP